MDDILDVNKQPACQINVAFKREKEKKPNYPEILFTCQKGSQILGITWIYSGSVFNLFLYILSLIYCWLQIKCHHLHVLGQQMQKKKADILYVEIEKWKRAMGMAKKTLVTFSKTSGVDVAHL